MTPLYNPPGKEEMPFLINYILMSGAFNELYLQYDPYDMNCGRLRTSLSNLETVGPCEAPGRAIEVLTRSVPEQITLLEIGM